MLRGNCVCCAYSSYPIPRNSDYTVGHSRARNAPSDHNFLHQPALTWNGTPLLGGSEWLRTKQSSLHCLFRNAA